MNNDKSKYHFELLREDYEILARRLQSLSERPALVMKTYFILIITTTSLVVFFLGRKDPSGYLCVIFAISFVFGFFTFIQLIANDVHMIDKSRRMIKIRGEMAKITPEIVDGLAEPMFADDKILENWISFKILFKRAYSDCGYKTQVAIVNSCLLTLSIVIPIWNENSWFAFVLIFIIFPFVAFQHALYARWRYMKAKKSLPMRPSISW